MLKHVLRDVEQSHQAKRREVGETIRKKLKVLLNFYSRKLVIFLLLPGER